MKVAIIGAGGRVGACTAYALQWGGVVSDVVLHDKITQAVEGETLDLFHGSALLHDQRFQVGDIECCAKANLIVVTAGMRRQPHESRLDLASRNAVVFLEILNELKTVGLRQDAILIVVSNPVDVLSCLAVMESDLPPHRIIGLGTLLDSCRFSSLIAQAIGAAPTQVRAFILGEHGDSMVPIWSSAVWAGIPLAKHPKLPEAEKRRIEDSTRESGAEIIRLKGGAGWAVATSIAVLIHSVVLDQRKVLPVSTWQTGTYGLRNVCLSVPTIIGAEGVVAHLEPELWPRELQGLRRSEQVVRESLTRITESLGRLSHTRNSSSRG